MTNLEHDLRSFVLRALLRYRNPLKFTTLKDKIRDAHPVAFTEDYLDSQLEAAERAGLIARSEDDVLGWVWDLTTKGKSKAQQLG